MSEVMLISQTYLSSCLHKSGGEIKQKVVTMPTRGVLWMSKSQNIYLTYASSSYTLHTHHTQILRNAAVFFKEWR